MPVVLTQYNQHMLMLANSVWYAAGPQPDLGNLTWGLPACIQAMSVVIALIHDSQ